MHKFIVTLLINLQSVLLAAVVASSCNAESIAPKGVGFTFSTGENDSDFKGCKIQVITENSPEPESLVFEYFLMKNNALNGLAAGFSLDVNDVTYENGKPKKLTKIPLTQASLESKNFNSSGRLTGGASPDGGFVLGTLDGRAAGQLIGSLSSGNYTIKFTRADMDEVRAYKINSKPPIDESKQFDACVAKLLSDSSNVKKP